MPADNARPFTKVIGYVRVSTKMQGDSGLGLAAQRREIEAYAERAGVTVLRIFEEVESGKNSNRPLLAEAVRLCGLTGSAMVAARVDRFGRKAADLMKLRDATFPVIPLDAPGEDGLLFGILALLAEKEAKSISQRTSAALRAAKAQGRVLGGARPGAAERARAVAARGTAALQARADARAAALRPVIEAMRERGVVTLSAIAAELTAEHIQAPRRKRWHASQVGRLLHRLEMAY